MDLPTLFRIDDVSVNTDLHRLMLTLAAIRSRVHNAKIVLAVSPLVHDMREQPEKDHERVFPRLLSAMSDHREFFKIGRGGNPLTPAWEAQLGPVRVASHGLIHVDHRLLSREVQELSIIASCSLLETTTFVPPFNKYNKDTLDIAAEHSIEVVRFEDGWRHVKHNSFNRDQKLWYFHPFDLTPVELDSWLAPQ
jgi:hypothetical protein